MQELRFQGSEASNAVRELCGQELIALILYGDFIKVENFCASKNTIKKIGRRKKQTHNGKKYLQNIYLIRNLYLGYIKNYYNSIMKTQLHYKKGPGSE